MSADEARRTRETVEQTPPWAPGSPGVLIVVADPEGELGPWRSLATQLSEILQLDLAVEPSPAPHEGEDQVESVLGRAAAASDPVLVLPPPSLQIEKGADVGERVLRRALAPFDTSVEVAAVSGPVLASLQAGGVEVAQLHIPTADTVPAMWEGPGHHAEAWHAELRRRHQVGTAKVEVAGGPPALTVTARSRQVDLVVLCWKRQRDAGRARVVRAVLCSTEVPVLFLALR